MKFAIKLVLHNYFFMLLIKNHCVLNAVSGKLKEKNFGKYNKIFQ